MPEAFRTPAFVYVKGCVWLDQFLPHATFPRFPVLPGMTGTQLPTCELV